MTIPAYLDMARLCQELCLSERTVEAHVAQGILPPPRKIGGKRLWKWLEVEAMLDEDIPHPEAERIRDATRKAFCELRKINHLHGMTQRRSPQRSSLSCRP